MSNFQDEVARRIHKNGENRLLLDAGAEFMRQSISAQYSYNYAWCGRPIIQYAEDIVGMQELIWQVKPDLIIETGIAHGGSLIFSASMLALLDYAEAVASGTVLDPKQARRHVLGIDIDIRAHNRAAIEAHPMAHRIRMIQGSSVAEETIQQVREIAAGYQRILICLDSNHTHQHVLEELEAYAPLTSKDSYCVVFDTVVEDLAADKYPDRPWGPGNNPKTAVFEYLRRLGSEGRVARDGAALHFEIDKTMENKLIVSVAPDGYLKRVTR